MGAQNEILAGKRLEDAIRSANSTDDVRELLHIAATASGATVRTGEAVRAVNGQFPQAGVPQRDVRGRFVSAEQPRTFTKIVSISGHEMEFTGDSAEEVETLIHVARQTAEAFQLSESSEDHGRRNQQGDAVSRVELEIKFRSGQISAADFLEQSGAIDDVLAARGISVDALKNATEKAFSQSWSEATQDFLNSSAGADWPGGEKNRDLVALTLTQLGLTDAPNKVQALATAYGVLKEKQMLFAPETEVNAAAEVADMRSSMANASHEEIVAAMESYKQNLRQQGRDENAINDQFVRNFSRTSSGLWGK